MLGRKLAERLARDGALGNDPIDCLTLVDAIEPAGPSGAAFEVECVVDDIAGASVLERLASERPAAIFHLAAVLSAQAEEDFELGYRVNLDGTRLLLEALRAVGEGYRPRFVYASSIAVFGAPFPETIGDDFFLTPLTSYGTQKALGELLVCDYSRRGIVDGVGVRLPTISVRP